MGLSQADRLDEIVTPELSVTYCRPSGARDFWGPRTRGLRPGLDAAAPLGLGCTEVDRLCLRWNVSASGWVVPVMAKLPRNLYPERPYRPRHGCPTIRCRGRRSPLDRQKFPRLRCLRERGSSLRGAPDLCPLALLRPGKT